MILDAQPTSHFLGRCIPCVRPVRGTQPQATRRYATLTCPQCGQPVRGERLYATTNADPCSGACMGATGPRCNCGCDGANHGRLWTYTGEETETALQAYRSRIAKQEQEAARRAEAQRDRRQREFDEWAEDYRDVVDYLSTQGHVFDEWSGTRPNSFLSDMERLINRPQPLTDRQAAAVRRCIAAAERIEQQKAAEAEAAQPVPTGNPVTITGRVVWARSEENRYGPGYSCRMLVKGTGWKVWSTVPSALIEAAGRLMDLEGLDVEFVAAVTSDPGDASTGYAKRPRRAKLLPATPPSEAANPQPAPAHA